MVDQLITTWTPPKPPGIYAVISAASGAFSITGEGTCAIVGKASTGPLNEVLQLGSPTMVEQIYGAASAVDRSDMSATMANLARNSALGGAISYCCVRVGSGGAAASLVLEDAASTELGTLAAAYPGADGNDLTATIRLVVGSTTLKELIVYRDQTPIQVTQFASGGDEATTLQAATAGQSGAVFTKTASGIFDVLTQEPLLGGIDPTVAPGDYTSAFALLSGYAWRSLVTDSEAPAVHSSLVAFLDEEIKFGRFRFGAVGEPTSVPLLDRLEAPAALNSCVVRYVGNGFVSRNEDGTYRNDEGYLAAAFDAGLLSTISPGVTMTWRTVPGALDIVGPVDEATAITAGMGTYTYNPRRGVRTGKGMSTLVDPSLVPIWALQLNDGWMYFDHTATAFGLIQDIGDLWGDTMADPDPLLRPPNTEVGRETLCALGDRVANLYIGNGWLASGVVIVDPAHPPTADTAWFTFQNLLVTLHAERLVLTLPFARP